MVKKYQIFDGKKHVFDGKLLFWWLKKTKFDGVKKKTLCLMVKDH